MKIKTVILLLISILSLCGCSNTPATSDATTKTEPPTEAVAETENSLSKLDSLGEVAVDKNLFDVTLTIPADYMGDSTQEELDIAAKENGYKSITLNDDGSATYVMTKSQHEEMLAKMSGNIHQALTEMIGSEKYPSFVDIKTNENFTEFTIFTTSTELNTTDTMSAMTFYMYGGIYAIFSGTSIDNVHVEFINADSGKLISASDSSDLQNVDVSTEE